MSESEDGLDRQDGDRDQKVGDPAGEARRVLAMVEATVLASRRRSTREEHRQRFADTIRDMFADG
jgi:hypothetical protein